MGALRGVRVLVVGGGLSGLVAARALSRDGASVHVVEARDRLGGLVWTLRDGLFAPFVVEAGGEFIDGSHTEIRALARELDLELVRVLHEGFGAGARGHRSRACAALSRQARERPSDRRAHTRYRRDILGPARPQGDPPIRRRGARWRSGPDGSLQQLVFEYAVVTVPPPILLEWAFTPASPDDQRRAFEALSYGTATKALLGFNDRWWRRKARVRAYGSNLPIGAVWESAEEQRGSAMLMLLAGGRASGELQAIIDREGAAGVVQWLARLGTPGSLEAFEIRWDRDPWARGGYAFFGTSFPPSWRDLLSRAFGRVLFAGDHTSRKYQGYMNGAVESGQRVAKEVIALENLRRLTSRCLL